jgi:hypothetical protein
MGVGTRVFSHCHTLLGIAGNKCSFSLYLDAIREALGENVMSKALIRSYVYPHQKTEVLDLLNNSPSWSKGRLIFKSCLGKRGVGLEVVSRVEDLPISGFEESSDGENQESWVTRTVFGKRIKADWMVQPYLYRPLLLSNRRKFHMRLYVVVTWHPLQVFLYRDGLALFASEMYDPDENVDDEDVLETRRTMHLTNSAVNMKVSVLCFSTHTHTHTYNHHHRHTTTMRMTVHRGKRCGTFVSWSRNWDRNDLKRFGPRFKLLRRSSFVTGTREEQIRIERVVTRPR